MRPEITDGLLVFISEPDRQAGMLVTPDWPPEFSAQIEATFQNQTLQRLSQGQASRGIVELTEAFDRVARARRLSGADSLEREPL